MGFLNNVKAELDKAKLNTGPGNSSGITISTTSIQEDFEIIDVIFAIDAHSEGFFTNADPGKAFDKVIVQLRSQCKKLGGDAVISCQFEYRVAVGKGLLGGSNQVMEIFAYGTVVKIK
jgi:uncharacterized protein YbjQ (UPF0145 family)